MQLSSHDIMMEFMRWLKYNGTSVETVDFLQVEGVPIKESDILIVIKLPL